MNATPQQQLLNITVKQYEEGLTQWFAAGTGKVTAYV